MRRAKVALFNDTSGAHFGCDLVVEQIRSHLLSNNAELIYSHPVGLPWKDSREAEEAIRAADVIIVNGEGTIHHSSEKALQLSQIGPYCAAEGKPAFLINSTIQENNAEIMSNLRAFAHVWVRENESHREVADAGIQSTRCPDLSLSYRAEKLAAEKGRLILVDSVQKKKTAVLARAADKFGAPLTSLKHRGDGILIYPKSGWLMPRTSYEFTMAKPSVPGTDFRGALAFLSSYASMITGRFHGLCMALILGIPATAMTSNTWKCEAMARDIGLTSTRIAGGSIWQLPPPYSRQETDAITSYLADAQTRAQTMFASILG